MDRERTQHALGRRSKLWFVETFFAKGYTIAVDCQFVSQIHYEAQIPSMRDATTSLIEVMRGNTGTRR